MEYEAEGTLNGVTCGLRARPGETPQQNGCHGLPVVTALERSGVVGSFGFLTVPRPNGTVAYLPERDFTEPTAVFEGTTPPLIYVDQGSTHFWRPPRLGDSNDVNAEDNIATVSGEGLVVGVHNGRVVEVQVTASTTATAAGQAVQFSAAASGGLPGEEFTYRWSFGDGAGGEGPGVSHAFAGSGTYQVRVTAIGSEDSGGESGAVGIVVGDPPTTQTPGATTTSESTAAQPAGAPGKGGEGRGGKGSKSSSQGGSKKKRKPRQHDDATAQRGNLPASRHSQPAATTGQATPEAVPAVPPVASPVIAEATGEAPSAGAEAEAEAGAVRRAVARSSSSLGERVEGRLVGDYLSGSAVEAGGSSAGQGSPSAAGAVGSGGVGVPLVALMVVGLLAAGALFEWRRGRPIR